MRKKKKLELESVCLILLITLAFSGCGKGRDGPTAENGQEKQEAENHESGLDTEDGQGEPEILESTGDPEQGAQSTQTGERDLNEALAAFREERTQTQELHGYTLGTGPEESNYPEIDFGKIRQKISDFDTREINDAFATARKYLQDKYGHEPVFDTCWDPRMYDIYGSDDKGVADGYDDGDIFLVEYEEDDGSWMYLTLVRDGNGSDWKVVGDGKDYTVPVE